MIKQILLLFLFNLSFSANGQNNILLISIHDKDTIDHKYPVFNWYYTPEPEGRDIIKYNFILVELKKNQSAESGVTVNQPLLRINGVQGFQLTYPYDAPELEYNKRYGWQLQKTRNNVVVEKSEAWEFILYRTVEVPMKYAVLNTDYSATTYEVNGQGFFFKLNSRYKMDGALNFKIVNERHQVVKTQLGEDQKLVEQEELEKTGRNYYYLKTSSLSSGTYTLEVKDQKGNKYNTRFRIK